MTNYAVGNGDGHGDLEDGGLRCRPETLPRDPGARRAQ